VYTGRQEHLRPVHHEGAPLQLPHLHQTRAGVGAGPPGQAPAEPSLCRAAPQPLRAVRARDRAHTQRPPLRQVPRLGQVRALLPVEELRAERAAEHERLQRAQDHRPRRLRRGLRLPQGRHGQDVRHEVSGQEAHQAEAGRGARAQRARHVVRRQQ